MCAHSFAKLLTVSIGVALVYPTAATEKYKEQMAIEGTSYKMKCTDLTQYNLSRPIVVWTVDGAPPTGPKYKILTDGLVIRNVSKGDTTANYTCTVLDRTGFIPVWIYANNIRLTLLQRTGKRLQHGNYISSTIGRKVKIWGIVNQWKTLQCNMFSRPSPTFEWRNEQSGAVIQSTTDLYRIVEDDSTSNLTIFIGNETLFGEYICKASNPLGESKQHFVLEKGYKPSVPFVFPTFIGKDKVTLRVAPQQQTLKLEQASIEALPINQHVFQIFHNESVATDDDQDIRNGTWKTLSDTTTFNETIPFISNVGGSTFEIKNLKESTTYILRCAVGNAASLSDFSFPLKVTTDKMTQSTISTSKEKEMKNGRKEHSRSLYDEMSDSPVALTATNESAESCRQPRFRKTVITTTTATTLIEDLHKMRGGNNSTVVRKRVVEDTAVDTAEVCHTGY